MSAKSGNNRIGAVLRSAMVWLMAAALSFGLTEPAQAVKRPVPSPAAQEKPIVTVQGNAVTKAGKFTGYFELALLVRTQEGASATAGDPALFRSAAVSLRYNASLLTPVSWTYAPNPEDPTDTTGIYDVTKATKEAPVYIPAKGPDENVGTWANVTGYTPAPGAAGVDQYDTALITLVAEAPKDSTGISYPEDTVVCVVRFKYDLSKLEMPVSDAFQYLLPENKQEFTAGSADKPDKTTVVWFSSDAEAAEKSHLSQSVWYEGVEQGESTYLYYYLNAKEWDSGTPTEPTTDGNVVLSEDSLGNKNYKDNLLKLCTAGTTPAAGDLVFRLVNEPSYAEGGVDLGNLVTILFYDWDDTLIGVKTVERGDARKDVNDYVEQNMIHPDLRVSANTGSEDDLANSLDREFTYRGQYPSDPKGGGVTRGDDAGTNAEGESLAGKDYPLTNKLDYAFYRRPTVMTDETIMDPGSVTPTGDHNYYWSVDKNDPANAADFFPYVNGWAVVGDVKNLDEIWTTFDTGELQNLLPNYLDDGTNAGSQIIANDISPSSTVVYPAGNPVEYSYKTSTTAGNDYLKFVDFSDLTALPDDQSILYVKACYEPGPDLLSGFQYSVVDGPYYSRYSTAASTEEATYSIQYKYARAYQYTDGWHGVNRTRDPAVQMEITPDLKGYALENEDASPFYLKVFVDNSEVVDVDLNTSGTIWSIGYRLVDLYGENIATGGIRSAGGEMNVPENFLYDKVSGDYDERQGTDGFVQIATMNTILKEATLYAQEKTNSYQSHFNLPTILDLNWRANDAGARFDMGNYFDCMSYVLDAVTRALAYETAHPGSGLVGADGFVKLDWHQIQYHIIHNGDGLGVFYADGSVRSVDNCGGFFWCHLDDCAGSIAVTIDNFQQLLDAARKAIDSSSPSQSAAQAALDKLSADWINSTGSHTSTGLRFRGSDDKDEFTLLTPISVADFVTRLKAFMTDAVAQGDPLTDLDDAWYQVQHALLHSGAYGPIGTITKDDYWWKDKDKKPTAVTIVDIPTLLSAAKASLDGNPVAWDALNMDTIRDVLRLRGSSIGDALTDLSALSDAGVFKQAVEDLVTAAGADYSKLTWYQIQHYLIDPSSGIVADDQISRHLYWWKDMGCDHKLPVGLSDLLEAMIEQGDTGLMTTQEFTDWLTFTVIDTHHTDLDPDNLNGLLGLGFRADVAGNHFGSGDMPTVVLRLRQLTSAAMSYGAPYYDVATHTIDLTWDQVQYYLIERKLVNDTTAIGQRYEWRPGGTADLPFTIATFQDLLEAAHQAVDGGSTGSLDTLTTDYLLGESLRKADGAVIESSDLDAVKQAVVAAVTAMGDDYKNTTWDQVQYAILHNAAATAADAGAESAASYWWKNNGQKVTDFAGLLTAMQEAANLADPRPARLNTVTLDMITGAPFYLKAGQDSTDITQVTEYTAATLERFKTDVTAIAKGGSVSSLTWNQLQYCLLNGTSTIPDAATATTESNSKYWWREGGKKVTDLSTLLEAVHQAVDTQDNSRLNTLTLDQLKGAPFWLKSDITGANFTSVADFLAIFKAMYQESVIAGDDYTNITWAQIQYYIAKNRSYVDKDTAEALILDDPRTFWWYEGGTKPVETMTFEKLLQKCLQYGLGQISPAEFDSAVTAQALIDVGFKGKNTEITDANFTSTYQLRIQNLYSKFKSKYYNSATGEVFATWDQVQYYLYNNKVTTPATATKQSDSTYTWRPDDHAAVYYVKTDGSVNVVAVAPSETQAARLYLYQSIADLQKKMADGPVNILSAHLMGVPQWKADELAFQVVTA